MDSKKNETNTTNIYEDSIEEISNIMKPTTFKDENIKAIFDRYSKIIFSMMIEKDEAIFKLRDDIVASSYDYMLSLLNIKTTDETTREIIKMINSVIGMVDIGCILIEIDRLIYNKPIKSVEHIVAVFNTKLATIIKDSPHLEDCIDSYICRLLASISESNTIFTLCFHEYESDKDVETYKKIIECMNSLGIISINNDGDKIFATKTTITTQFYITYWSKAYERRYPQ